MGLHEGRSLMGLTASCEINVRDRGHRFPALRRLFHPTPNPLIKDGEVRRDNMRRELITEEELVGKLPCQGITEVEGVKEAHVESVGQVSVVGRVSK